MSAMEKLQIRGIRSFSPHRDETIEFYSPLTMIVGANGCGKTTIIECLKMACTGQMPPNCKSGQSFINDPSMTETTEVKAHIKLRFTNKAGNPSVVVRLFQITKRRNKLEFKSLDGTVRMADSDGNKETLSHKCSDLDKLIPEMLGMGSPIMESVVFCHQEESTWPLSEGAVLKKKFDDIFDSSRYAKALDAIVKSKKEFTAKGKDLKVEVAELGAHLLGASSTREELSDKEEKAQECLREVQDIAEKTEAIEEKLADVQSRLRAAEKTQHDLNELRRRTEESERRVTDRLPSLEQEFTESDMELKRLLDGFDEQMSSRRKDLGKMKQQNQTLQNAVASGRDKVNTYNKRLGEGFAIQQEFTASAEREAKLVKDITRQLNLTAQPIESSSSGGTTAREREARVEWCLREIGRLGESCKLDGQREISSAQTTLDSAIEESRAVHTQLQKLQLEMASEEKELTVKNKQKTQFRTELANCDSSASQRAALPEAEADVARAKSEWEEFEASYASKNRQLQEERRSVDQQIADLVNVMAIDSRLHQDMSLHRAENERLDAQRRQGEADLSVCVATGLSASDKYRDLISRHITANGSALDATAVCSFSTARDVETVTRFLTAEAVPRLTRTLTTASDELESVQRELARLQAEKEADSRRRLKMESSMEELRQAELSLQANMQRLVELRKECDLEDLPAVSMDDPAGLMAAIKLTEECAAEEEMALRSSKSWREVIFRKSRDHVPPSPAAARGAAAYVRRCPCCERGLTADETVVFERSVEKLLKAHKATEDIIAGVKARVDKARNLAKHAAECFVKITGFGPQRVELKEIQTRVTEASNRDSVLKDRERQLRATLENASRDKNELAVCVMELDRLHSDWVGITQRLLEVQQKLGSSTRGLSGDPNDRRSISDIEEQQRRREVEREDLQRRKERLMEDDNRLAKKMHALKATLAERERTLMEVVQRVARVAELEGKLREIEASERSLATSREAKSREITHVRRSVADKEATEKAAREELKRAEEAHRQALQRIDNFRRDLAKVNADCSAVQRRLEAVDTPAVQLSLDSVERELQARLLEIDELTPRMRALEDQLLQEERTKKLVLDNIAYRACKAEAEGLREKLVAAQARLGPTAERDYRNAERELQKGLVEKQRLEKDRHNLEGRMSALEEQIGELERKLKTPMFKDIDKRHRLKNIEYETTMVAVSDLDCYYHALDSALQKFHTIRIDEINKIIKELWQLVYRGGDIDCIELVSGSEDGAVKTTRNYNYRVVMRKGDSPLDMRGRCSAGQRVLASIVIRLALAETFCVSCGMLALDEPTTNLDEAHKAGLAHALSRIIASRARQHNFQLIVITHDEDFVRLMNLELSAMTDFSMPEHYFRICRMEEGTSGKYFSHIERIPWDDM